jgi:hypothetical protein
MTIRGSCSCYGHADRCLPEKEEHKDIQGMVHGTCDCTHNTRGHNCEYCIDDHNDVPWRPATGKKKNECLSNTFIIVYFYTKEMQQCEYVNMFFKIIFNSFQNVTVMTTQIHVTSIHRCMPQLEMYLEVFVTIVLTILKVVNANFAKKAFTKTLFWI